MQILKMILLVVLPYGTAIICGAITEWAGKTVSGWCSIGGPARHLFFFQEYGPFGHGRLFGTLLIRDIISGLTAAIRIFGRPCLDNT